MRRFHDLNEQEVLSLAIDVEKCNSERFQTLADLYEGYDDEVHALFLKLRDEEIRHADLLLQEWQKRYGDTPRSTLQETHVREVIECVDLENGEHTIFDDVDRDLALQFVQRAEKAAREFYVQAANNCLNPGLRALYNDLAAMEDEHVTQVSSYGR